MILPKSIARDNSDGFTLVELIVVMAVLSIILALVLVAINPAKRLRDAADTQRRSDINTILNASQQFNADRRRVPAGISVTSTTTLDSNTANGKALCHDLVDNGYIGQMPVDSASNGSWVSCDNYNTMGYTIKQNINLSVTVEGGVDVNGQPIKVTR